MHIQARREAKCLGCALVWAPAADCVGCLEAPGPAERWSVRNVLARTYSIHDTGRLHSILVLYVGTRVRVSEKGSAADSLVQEAEGTVVAWVTDPQEADGGQPGEAGDERLLEHARVARAEGGARLVRPGPRVLRDVAQPLDHELALLELHRRPLPCGQRRKTAAVLSTLKPRHEVRHSRSRPDVFSRSAGTGPAAPMTNPVFGSTAPRLKWLTTLSSSSPHAEKFARS